MQSSRRRRWLPFRVTMSHRIRVALTTLAAVALLPLSVTILIIVAPHVTLPIGPSTPAGSTRLSAALVFGVTASVYCALAIFVAVTVNNKLRGSGNSPFLLPIILTAIGVGGVLTIAAITQFDLLAHNFVLRWRNLMDQEVRLASQAFFVLVGVGFWVKVYLVLRGHNWHVSRILLLCAVVNVAVFVSVLALLVILRDP